MDCNTDDSITLQQIGLTKQEAKMYLTLQQRPAMTAAAAIKAGGFSYASAYRALNGLAAKGFATSSRIIGTRRYKAVPLAQALEDYVEQIWVAAAPLLSRPQ